MNLDKFHFYLDNALGDDPTTRIGGVLAMYRELLQVDALAITVISPKDRKYHLVSNAGYEQHIAHALTQQPFNTLLQLNRRKYGYYAEDYGTWDLTNFGETAVADELLRPADYQNGMSARFTDENGELYGYLHSNLRTPRIDPRLERFLVSVRDVLAKATYALHEKLKADLSPREEDILSLLASGRTTPQIAEQLWISRRTVSTHIDRVLRKTGSANRVQAATWGVRHGYGAPKIPAGAAPNLSS